ncbi:MAG: tRNA uridine-5-carboxymethylaminomethyl(34) synthesis GTPase MnmE, partial [Nitrospiria bacterium]
IRETSDPVEIEGVRRARKAIDGADLILAVFDGSAPAADDDRAVLAALKGRPVIAVANKADLPSSLDGEAVSGALDGTTVLRVSTLTREGIDTLTAEMVRRLGGGVAAKEGALVTKLRHVEALKRADVSLAHLKDTLAERGPQECLALDLRGAADALGEIVGTVTTDEVLKEIFSKFCIGK